eukprot:5871760-Alexandrium_andersonii.AAC.1
MLEHHPPRSSLAPGCELAVGRGSVAREPVEVGHEDLRELLGQHIGLRHLRTDPEAIGVQHLADARHLR